MGNLSFRGKLYVVLAGMGVVIVAMVVGIVVLMSAQHSKSKPGMSMRSSTLRQHGLKRVHTTQLDTLVPDNVSGRVMSCVFAFDDSADPEAEQGSVQPSSEPRGCVPFGDNIPTEAAAGAPTFDFDLLEGSPVSIRLPIHMYGDRGGWSNQLIVMFETMDISFSWSPPGEPLEPYVVRVAMVDAPPLRRGDKVIRSHDLGFSWVDGEGAMHPVTGPRPETASTIPPIENFYMEQFPAMVYYPFMVALTSAVSFEGLERSDRVT